MPLDTTVAGASADAYITVAEGDTFAGRSLSGFAAAWTAANTATKENAIRQATVDVDAHVRSTDPWTASVYQPTPPPAAQRLLFPRAIDYTGAAPGTPFIEDRVKQATWEQAAYLLANQKLLDDAARRRARGMFSFSEDEGPSGTLAIDATIGRFSPAAAALLRSLIGTGRAGVRSVPLRSLGYRAPFEVIG